MFLILIISFCYVVTSLIFLTFNNIIDYFFIFYALLTILRTFIIVVIIRSSSIKELKKYFTKIPLAKNSNMNFLFIAVVMLISFVYYQNLEILSIALGRSFYIGLFSIEIFDIFYKTKS